MKRTTRYSVKVGPAFWLLIAIGLLVFFASCKTLARLEYRGQIMKRTNPYFKNKQPANRPRNTYRKFPK
jgi:hypothetical protein